MSRRLLLLALAVPWAGLAHADEVFIHGGGHLTGEVIERGPTSILVDIGTGQIGLPLSEVERIVPGESPVGVYRRQSATLAADDVEGWLALAFWARDRRLETNARDAFERVLAADPGHASAHRALGHVLFDGRWMTRDETYLARGYVRFEGRWVTPEERRAAMEERRAAAEERQLRAEAEARVREAEARARMAEAEAARAEAEVARVQADVRPDALTLSEGAGWSPWYAGTFYSPTFYAGYAYPGYGYPAYPYRSRYARATYGFASPYHSCGGGCSQRADVIRSSRVRAPHRIGPKPPAGPHPAPARPAARRSR